MTGLIKLSAGTTGCEWRIRNTNFTEECNLLGYSVSNARERGAGPSGALTERSLHPDWLSVGTDVLMSLRLERWMSLQAMTDAPKGKTDGSDSGSVWLWAVKLRNNGNNHSKKRKAAHHERGRGPCPRIPRHPGKKGETGNSWEWLKAYPTFRRARLQSDALLRYPVFLQQGKNRCAPSHQDPNMRSSSQAQECLPVLLRNGV